MKQVFLFTAVPILLLAACTKKEVKQGQITYKIEYQLPDSLKKYEDFLPKAAIVYFKGDSTVSVQQAGDEATTVITHKPTGFMRVLLSSPNKKFQIDYERADQPEILPARAGYTYVSTNESTTIAGYKALKYELTDKATGLTSEAWFSKEISVVPNYLTTVFDTTYGVPLAFTTKQNGMPVKTTATSIKFGPVPDGAFSTPPGYQKITPKQFKDMPVEN
jgi:hypothetical protein